MLNIYALSTRIGKRNAELVIAAFRIPSAEITQYYVIIHLPTFYTCPGSHDGVPTHDGVLDESVFLAGMGMEWGESQWGAGSTNKIDNFKLQSDGLRLWSLKKTRSAKISLRPTVPTHEYFGVLQNDAVDQAHPCLHRRAGTNPNVRAQHSCVASPSRAPSQQLHMQ